MRTLGPEYTNREWCDEVRCPHCGRALEVRHRDLYRAWSWWRHSLRLCCRCVCGHEIVLATVRRHHAKGLWSGIKWRY